jgi:hypothetical protein
MIASTTTSGSPDSVDIQARGGFAAGSSFEEPHTVAAPRSVTWQATYNDGTHEQVATAWTTGESSPGGCVFTGQGFDDTLIDSATRGAGPSSGLASTGGPAPVAAPTRDKGRDGSPR